MVETIAAGSLIFTLVVAWVVALIHARVLTSERTTAEVPHLAHRLELLAAEAAKLERGAAGLRKDWACVDAEVSELERRLDRQEHHLGVMQKHLTEQVRQHAELVARLGGTTPKREVVN